MSAIGSARALGPEMWSDMERRGSVARLVAGFVEQRPHRRVLEQLGSRRMVENLLEGCVDSLGLPDLLHRAGIVPGVRRGRLLGAQDERPDRRQVGEAVIAVH